MRFFGGAALAFGLFSAATASLHPVRSYETHDYFALHLEPSTPPSEIAERLGARHEGQVGELADHHTFSVPRENGADLDTLLDRLRDRRKLKRRAGADDITLLDKRDAEFDGILWSQKLAPKKRLQKRLPPPRDLPRAPAPKISKEDPKAVQFQKDIVTALGIADPIFEGQWHLYNTVQVGNDLNVTGVWLEGNTGQGVITAVVDDGLDMYSNDLKPNYFAEGSYDYNDHHPEPRPVLPEDRHGTRCAGEIAAAKNDICGVGVAYDSKVAGIRILSKAIDDTDEAKAINHGYQQNDIYSCSWGPPDDGMTMEAPGVLIKKAMVNGVQKGRAGKGSIFVFAAGNGAGYGDNCNFDGYTNSIYSITVGAIDREGKHGTYSESCSAQLVVTYSSGSSDAIHTTDVGTDKCYSLHGGTSAAGPLAAGSVALALSARPELSWRDAQYLLVETAVPVHEDDESWQMTKSGRKFSHDWGFGKVDAYALVQKAKTWQLVKPQAWFKSPWLRVKHEIPQGDKGLASSYEVTAEMIKKANVERLEHVTVTMNVNHTRRGDLSAELRSPEGVLSQLSTARRSDSEMVGYVDWTFMSVAHWGESGVGTWTVIVKDTTVNDDVGEFIDWRLNLWGEAIDGANQPLHPLPDEHDDDHTIEDAIVATTSVEPGPTKTGAPEPPVDAVDRPVNAKPGSTGEPAAPPPSPPVDDEPTPAEDNTSAAPTTATTVADSDNLLPSFFPTFGASKRTQAWIYAAIGSIIVFCIGLGIYFNVQRRNRQRNDPRDDYDFEMIEDEDEMQMAGKPGTTQRRGGELYNAFAGESDEEPLFSDEDDDEPYRDRAASDDQEGSHGHGEHGR
ncbi:subtilisin-like pro protein convertase [Aspergillus campestris IBT 28561]|uniref:Subtilisin-like pro protein convertase n=1 Tax=Aspergillus campestris (strain IBT 28561) TaxID=1392248 RepID=A0A2I1DC96_ASPC2|nr:subtilisin-like pro protein convertase [Aspergillus campestris IBT 28561]PKY07470.1 subtilisin-like pro protein convertase [Aspergillus campestris IBT 28561]